MLSKNKWLSFEEYNKLYVVHLPLEEYKKYKENEKKDRDNFKKNFQFWYDIIVNKKGVNLNRWKHIDKKTR